MTTKQQSSGEITQVKDVYQMEILKIEILYTKHLAYLAWMQMFFPNNVTLVKVC